MSIGYQTGLVTVAEIAPNFQDYTNSSGLAKLNDVISKALSDPMTTAVPGARQFARESQSVGGR